ncbi:hypothetical protein C8J56DRAFT_965860 [Mycena floridula]|nr:hypothetical protein C8J56DRAFT_965860 [Mycena floridula]
MDRLLYAHKQWYSFVDSHKGLLPELNLKCLLRRRRDTIISEKPPRQSFLHIRCIHTLAFPSPPDPFLTWIPTMSLFHLALFSSAHSIDFADRRIKIVTAGKCGQSVGANGDSNVLWCSNFHRRFCSKIDRGLDVWLRVHKVTLVFVAYW